MEERVLQNQHTFCNYPYIGDKDVKDDKDDKDDNDVDNDNDDNDD